MGDPGILPDSRCLDPKGLIPSKMGNWVPIFCANCGKPQGAVPEENTTFVCWFCDPCAEKFGAAAETMFTPDEVFWKMVAREQFERYGRLLTPEEWQRVGEDLTHPMHVLLRNR